LAHAASAQQKTVDERFFAEKVYPILEKAECRMCHNDNGVSSATRLKFPAARSQDRGHRNFRLECQPWWTARMWRNRCYSTNRQCASRIQVESASLKGSAEEETFKAWVAYLAKLTETQLNAAIVRIGSRQHGSRQWGGPAASDDQSIQTTQCRDLLSDYTRSRRPISTRGLPQWLHQSDEGQSVPPLLAEAYTIAAEKAGGECVPARR